MKRGLPLAALVLSFMLRTPLPAIEAEIRSQLSGWFSLNDDRPSTPRFGLRWQPSLSLSRDIGSGWKLDGEFSLAADASGSAPSWSDPAFDGEIRPYRLWLRLSSQRFEARLGLQKINFGSATVFRPLMWFDRVDPRDPLQLTDGTWGLLLRYYFKGNANAWLWGLYGNTASKGWETLPTARHAPEFGGRLQIPLFSGEAAASAHFRRSAATADPAGPAANESRFALDGKWDIGAGLWAEAALIHRRGPLGDLTWERSATLGIDYTLGLGNGLYVLAEQFFSGPAASPLGAGSASSFSALLARYPLGLLDSLSAIVYFAWRDEQIYSFVSWQRTTDRWQFHVMAFCNPRRPAGLQGTPGPGLFAGRGAQLLAVWNP